MAPITTAAITSARSTSELPLVGVVGLPLALGSGAGLGKAVCTGAELAGLAVAVVDGMALGVGAGEGEPVQSSVQLGCGATVKVIVPRSTARSSAVTAVHRAMYWLDKQGN